MRYSIIGATTEKVKAVGGLDIKASSNLGIIFATLTPSQATALKSQGYVVTLVKRVSAPVTPPVPVEADPRYFPQQLIDLAGLEELRALTRPMLYGKAVNLAVIDTGIRESHEKIKGHVIYKKNFTSDTMDDGFDHGTGVASIVLSVAPLCNILNMKVLDSRGQGTEEEVAMAIDECIALRISNPRFRPTVINLSLGGEETGEPDTAIRVACRRAIDEGIWVVAAAGNNGPSPMTVMSPACERYVFAVGSLSSDTLLVSRFSSRGPTEEGLIKPDLSFMGEDIILASSRSDTATKAGSGTSFATPFMAGLGLLFQEAMLKYGGVEFVEDLPGPDYPEITELVPAKDMLDKYLEEICVKPAGEPLGKDNSYGYGLVWGLNLKSALTALTGVTVWSQLMSGIATVFSLAMLCVVTKSMVKSVS